MATTRSTVASSLRESRESAAEFFDVRHASTGPYAGGKASIYSAAFNIANTILGAGMLGLPAALSKWGVVFGMIGLVVAAACAALGLILLSECADIVGRPAGFYDVAEKAQHRLGLAIDIAVAIKCFGVAVSYIIVVGDSIPLAVGAGHGVVSDRHFWVIAAVATAAPVCYLRKMDSLRFTSIFALMCVAFVIVVIVLFATPALDACTGAHIDANASNVGGDSLCGGKVDVLPTQGVIAFLTKLSTFVFSYTCHQNIFATTNELYKPTKTRINGFIISAISCCTVIYTVIVLCGYFTYGDAVTSDVLETYPDKMVVTVARIAISVCVVFSFPMQLHPARACIISIINSCATSCCAGTTEADPEVGTKQAPPSKGAHPERICEVGPTFGGRVSPDESMHFIITTVFIALAFVIAMSVTDLGIVLSVVGATGSTIVSYILPGMCYWRLGPKGCKRWLALVLFLLGCTIMPTALTVLFL